MFVAKQNYRRPQIFEKKTLTSDRAKLEDMNEVKIVYVRS